MSPATASDLSVLHPTRAIISLAAFRNNLRAVRSFVGKRVKIMAVVKANGYGHGMLAMARAAMRWGVDYLAVARVDEGLALRAAGVEAPILVFEVAPAELVRAAVAARLELTVVSVEQARQVSETAGAHGMTARVHAKVDTGMGRLGMGYAAAASVVESVVGLPSLALAGVYSHFATAEEQDQSFARLQLVRFNRVLQDLAQRGIAVPLRHMAGSGAIMTFPEAQFDMVRPGVMLYGYAPRRGMPGSEKLVPVMSLVSHISMLKRVEPNTGISYGRRYVTRSHTRIATVPIGYGDGYSRMLTGKAEVLIHGKRFPVAGTVCMDHIMVDVGNVDAIQPGEAVTLIGREGDLAVTAWDIAERLGTIPYEVTCMVAERVPRVYVE